MAANPNLTAGILFILGAVIFGAAASVPALSKAWVGTVQEYLATVAAHGRVWRWVNVSFLAGVIITALGFGALTVSLRAAGDGLLSEIGLVGFLLAAALWAVFEGYRLSVPVWAAREMVSTAAPPTVFEPFQMWAGWIFNTYMVIAYLSTLVYGLSVLTTGLLSGWVGWLSIAVGFVGAASMVTGQPKVWGFPLFEPPAVVHAVPLIMGIALLLK
jgi:hypothetical protein